MILRILRLAVVSTAMMTASAALAQQAAATFNTPTNTQTAGVARTYGFSFTATQALDVTALGIFDSNGDGFATTHMIGLWDSNGNNLASISVPTGMSGTLATGVPFRYYNLATPYTLVAGQSYTVGADSWNTDQFAFLNPSSAPTTVAGITYNQSRYAAASNSSPNIQNTVVTYVTADFLVSPAAAAPEPSTWLLMGVGVFGAGAMLRRRKVAVPAIA